MKKNEIVSDELLKEKGFKHYFNYGNWEIWASKTQRVYRDIKTNVIKYLWDTGKEVDEI